MKNILNKFLLLAAVAGLGACTNDIYQEVVKGDSAEYAYIVGGTEALYQATSCEVFHTPDSEDGSVEMSVTVALTKAQGSATNIKVGVDNSKIESGYEPAPQEVLKYDGDITIPAGETSATIHITVANKDLPKLSKPKYQIPFVIQEVNNVKISTNSNVAYLIVITENIDPANNIISMPAVERNYVIKNYLDKTTGDEISTSVTISGTDEAYLPFDIELGVDNTLIAAYNEEHGTSFVALPSTVVPTITKAAMGKDAKSATANVSLSYIKEDDFSDLKDGNGYLVPVVIKDVDRATLAADSGVLYLVIEVRNIESSSNFFSALYLGDHNFSTDIKFSKPISFPNGYTYVFHCFIDEVTNVSRIASFRSSNGNWVNFLRFGQKGNKDTRLEWWVGPGALRKTLYTEALAPQTWYQIVLQFTGKEYRFYVRGGEWTNLTKMATVTLTDEELAKMGGVATDFQLFEFNSSWGGEGYRRNNEFHGRIWQMAIFNQVVSESYLSNYCYRGYHSALVSNSRYGMCAYWPFNEGGGHICYEGTGRYENIDFSKTQRENEDGSIEYVDVSSLVQWKADSFNSFD